MVALQVISKRQVFDAERAGRSISQTTVDLFERQLSLDQEDLGKRITLAAFYRERLNFPQNIVSLSAHVAWIIQNASNTCAASCMSVQIDRFVFPLQYADCRELWLDQLNVHADDIDVYHNAVRFFVREPALTLDTVVRAMSGPHFQLGDHIKLAELALAGVEAASVLKEESTVRRLLEKCMEIYLNHVMNGGTIDNCFEVKVARSCYSKNHFARASEFAERVLNSRDDVSDYGYCQHQAQVVLGLVALSKDDLRTAEMLLQRSTNIGKSSHVNLLGPSMDLATELLKVNRRKSVLRYLLSCWYVWPRGRKHLARWICQLVCGMIPSLEI